MEQHAESFHPVEKRKPKEQGYKKYKVLGGILSPEQYRDVLERAANGALSNSRWAEYARSMARKADIALSPKTEAIYGILREEQNEDYSGRSDQELFLEALRLDGDASSLAVFTKKFPNIFKKKPPIIKVSLEAELKQSCRSSAAGLLFTPLEIPQDYF